MSTAALQTPPPPTELQRRELSFDLNGREWFYEIDIVDVNACYTDRFQRPLNERWLKKAEANFRPYLLGTVTVSERQRRNRTFSVVDGQHRLELVQRKGVSVIAACVFTGLTIKDEAALFSDLQQERRGITPFQRFQADLVADRPVQKAIDAMLADKEVRLELSESSDGPGKIKCVRLLERMFEDDPARMRMVLTLAQRTWGGQPLARSERFVGGLWRFVREEDKRASHGGAKVAGGAGVDVERFVDRLASRTPSSLQMKAQQLRDGSEYESAGLPQFMAEAISNAYRSQKRK